MRAHFENEAKFSIMNLTAEQKKFYRGISHHLNPVVTVAGNGLTDTVLAEIDRALEDHELIKVKVSVGDRDLRAEVIKQICTATRATLVFTIGNVALLLRKARKPNAKLSNLVRFKN